MLFNFTFQEFQGTQCHPLYLSIDLLRLTMWLILKRKTILQDALMLKFHHSEHPVLHMSLTPRSINHGRKCSSMNQPTSHRAWSHRVYVGNREPPQQASTQPSCITWSWDAGEGCRYQLVGPSIFKMRRVLCSAWNTELQGLISPCTPPCLAGCGLMCRRTFRYDWNERTDRRLKMETYWIVETRRVGENWRCIW